MTEQMRREMILALSVAKARHIDYGNATEEQRRSCHRIARACLPGANQLIADERINTQSELGANMADHLKSEKAKTYDDAFEDGRKGDYNNRFKDKSETWVVDDLLMSE